MNIYILCFFTTFQREIFDSLLHCIHYTAIGTTYFSDVDFTDKAHDVFYV